MLGYEGPEAKHPTLWQTVVCHTYNTPNTATTRSTQNLRRAERYVSLNKCQSLSLLLSEEMHIKSGGNLYFKPSNWQQSETQITHSKGFHGDAMNQGALWKGDVTKQSHTKNACGLWPSIYFHFWECTLKYTLPWGREISVLGCVLCSTLL